MSWVHEIVLKLTWRLLKISESLLCFSPQNLYTWWQWLSNVQVSRVCYKLCMQARREGGGKGRESFPGPRDVWGALPSLKNTENGVPGGFFMTKNMHKIHFRPGLRPGPRWGSLQRSPEPLVGWWGNTSPHVSSLSTPSVSQSQDIQKGGDRAPR